MFRVRFYTDMHGIETTAPSEERMTVVNTIANWQQAWTDDKIIEVDCGLLRYIPAREIRYMEIEEI